MSASRIISTIRRSGPRDAWLRLWLDGENFDAQDEENYRRRILVMTSTLWLLLVVVAFIAVNLVVDFTPAGQVAANVLLLVAGGSALLTLGTLRFLRSRQLALNLLLVVVAAAFTASCFYFGGMQSPTLPGLLLIPLTAGIAGSLVSGITWSVIIAAIWVTLFTMDNSGYPFTQIINPANYDIAMLMTYMGLGATVISIILVYAQLNMKLREAQQRINRELETLSRHDPLTGLPNRRYYEEHCKLTLERAAECGTLLGLLSIDLDGFKAINDIHGHGVGDRFLVQIARRLQEALRETDLVARLGGDEFMVVIENVGSAEDVVAVGNKLIAAVERPITIRQQVFHPSASCGIAVYPMHGNFRKELEARADQAMYRAKRDTDSVALAG